MRFPRFIRRLADPVTERVPVPIVGGLNRGRFWSLASAGSGYATGRRAGPQMRLLHALIRPRDVFWDVGAHHGYVSLMASEKVGARGEVYAFEPGARNAGVLRRHLRWNRVGNVRVETYALGAADGEADFGGGDTSKMHALGGGGERVRVRTVRSLVQAGELPPPDVVKIDVEGGEADVLAGALDVLPAGVRLVIAIHSAAMDRACVSLLETHGFAAAPTPELTRARASSAPWPGDPDLLAVGPGVEVAELEELLR
ncbi:MAG: FkbM family methyltransferase [Gemmatimonadota bacterium]